jgi:hypothetical protein
LQKTDEANRTHDEPSRRRIHTIHRTRYDGGVGEKPRQGSGLRGPMVNAPALRETGESLTLFHGESTFHPHFSAS